MVLCWSFLFLVCVFVFCSDFNARLYTNFWSQYKCVLEPYWIITMKNQTYIVMVKLPSNSDYMVGCFYSIEWSCILLDRSPVSPDNNQIQWTIDMLLWMCFNYISADLCWNPTELICFWYLACFINKYSRNYRCFLWFRLVYEFVPVS